MGSVRTRAKSNTGPQIDSLLLGVIAGSPGHGYAVISALRERSEGVFDLAEGAVYPALHKLEDQGLLASEWEPHAGRRRRVYRLTDRGHQALEQEREGWRRFAQAVDAVLAVAAPAAATVKPNPALA